jgi:glutamate-5-semialdehyde dehydrogenase
MGQRAETPALVAGMPIFVEGDRFTPLPAEVAERFEPGDHLVVVPATGEVRRIPRVDQAVARAAVDRAAAAFARMGRVADAQIAAFFSAFAARLERDDVWSDIASANTRDVAIARARGRSITRLVTSEAQRRAMIAGLRGWASAPSQRGRVLERLEHDRFRVELIADALGVVAFVFEGRINVLADACGVIRGGNTVVLRIGSDALGTARALMSRALEPARQDAGLPEGVATLVDSESREAGLAVFSDARVALAIARGSGAAVASLGSVARRAGIPTSLHGTGGAWIIASEAALADVFGDAVRTSLDRKVCNTLNTLCIPASRQADLVPIALAQLEAAGERLGQPFKLHVAESSAHAIPQQLYTRQVVVARAEGDVTEPQAERLPDDALGHEWEWEQTPEITLAIVPSVDAAIELFNRLSPRFAASLISPHREAHAHFYERIESPFVGDGFTRWVDGQRALCRPELGLSSWENGRLFTRGGILAGDGVYAVRTRYTTTATDR